MINWDNSMNSNEMIQTRNDNPTRMRSYNEAFIPNYYPINIGMQPIMNYYPQQVVLNTNGGYSMVNSTNESSPDQSGLLSPSIEGNSDRPLYRIATWQDIADKYDGSEQRPKCGRLNNNVYFTQRATSSDVYMLFDRKSDYINNFVNYYFSDKNLARDQKLVALMDDKGVIPLSALTKFPKLHQIDSSIEDLIMAFQTNNFVMSVDMNGEKGAQRRDKWCPSSSQKNVLDKPSEAVNESLTNSLLLDQTQNIAHNDNIPAANQPLYYFNPLISTPTYTQQPGMMLNAANIGGLPSYSPFSYVPVNASYQAHQINQAGLNAQPNNASMFWQMSSPDYSNQNLIQAMPISRYSATNLEAPGNR